MLNFEKVDKGININLGYKDNIGGGVVAISNAANALSGLNLGKSLVSEAQMAEAGTEMAGPNAGTVFRGVGRVASEYRGSPEDWAKMTSSSYSANDGTIFQTHWVQNLQSGERVEFKTVLGDH